MAGLAGNTSASQQDALPRWRRAERHPGLEPGIPAGRARARRPAEPQSRLFVDRLKETNAPDLRTTIARVIDPATVPSKHRAGQNPDRRSRRGAHIARCWRCSIASRTRSIDSKSRIGSAFLPWACCRRSRVREERVVSELAFFNDTQSTFAEAVPRFAPVLMSSLDEQQGRRHHPSSGGGKTTCLPAVPAHWGR